MIKKYFIIKIIIYRLGKFIFGIYNYYHTDKLVLLNSIILII